MSEILIRHCEVADAPALHQLYAHPSVYRDTLQLPFPSEEVWTKRLSQPTEHVYKLVACLNGQVVGQLTVETNTRPRRRHVAGFGMGVAPQAQRRGVGSRLMEAMIELCDGWLNVERIEMTVFVDNQAALALYIKYGFVVEGTSKRYALREGVYVDVHHMARLRPGQPA
ncbi:GNAT family N-acetyltransferase [Pseudomonas mangiferae]|uniref:GNAT family N-acetyltransferase n=1 Tax=Pseudomonas mangiferae TaxID=2593654 RepID=A0A553GZX2_9PSED|nr:GNAT family N-acetyltransferase [Pseudomonas mangiferae]TRX75013.1 GNAT family N-acetyltransferase [Pseudomonas mangiferae]